MRSSFRGQRLTLLVSAFAVSFALNAPLTATAQSDPAAPDGSGVARISVADGSVTIQRGDSSDTFVAALNAPVLGGDYLTTGDASRGEVQFDGTTQLRLADDAQLRFTQLDTGNRTLQLAQGTIELRLLAGTDGASEIDTPSISIKPRATGKYRVTVTADGQTLVTVRSGRAEIDSPQGPQDLAPGSTLAAQGGADAPSMQSVAVLERDDFDRFNSQRDHVDRQALAESAFVNTDISGVADLGTYGRWVDDGTFGNVWIPASVGPDWAPYRDGRWVWEDGYGWTWVAAEPWGWAPYHYGSWYHSPVYGWAWYPPPPRVYAPWRPALVAFIGFGSGAGFSIGFGGGASFGNIGWVPLAPFEPYHPWWGNRYGGSTTVVNNVTNITNVTNVTVYKNVQYNAVSSVTSQQFLQGGFAHNTPVAASQLGGAQAFRGALPVVPTAANLRFTSAAAAPAAAVRPAFAARAFAGTTAVVRRTPFTEQRVALATVTHAPITPLNFKDAQTTPVGGSHPAAAAAQARPAFTTPAGAAPGSNSWARFNASRSASPAGSAASTGGGAYHAPAVTHPAHASEHASEAHRTAVHQKAPPPHHDRADQDHRP